MSEEELPAVVVDLGKVKKKHVRRLRRGEGKLLNHVEEVLEVVRDELGDELNDKQLLPVVMVVREKTKRRRLLDL